MYDAARAYVLGNKLSKALIVSCFHDKYFYPPTGLTNYAKNPDLVLVNVKVGWKRVSKPYAIHMGPEGFIDLNMFPFQYVRQLISELNYGGDFFTVT